MDYQQNQAHVQAFLVDAAFDRLSKNQQEHAQSILQQVNQLMADRHQLDDCHWTSAALAAVLDHELYQDGQASYRQVISTIPVLKAYQKFLKTDQEKELVQTMDEHRKTMQANWKAAADKSDAKPAAKTPRKWTPESYLAWQKTMVAVAPESNLLKNVEGLDETDKQYLIDEFLTLMNQEAHQWPDTWTFDALQQVLGMTMPLDPHIKPYQIVRIVALFDAFFAYLHQQNDLDDNQYQLAKRTLLHMQPAQEALASLNRKDRLTQLVMSLAQAEGVDTSNYENAQRWMATHRTLLTSFVGTIMHPWRDYDAREQNNEMAKRVAEKKMAPQASTVKNAKSKKHPPVGISFRNRRQKSRRKH